MSDLRASGLGGVPKGTTSDRPSSPSIGDVFYNGTLGNLEIYTSNGWSALGASPLAPTLSAVNSPLSRAYNNGKAVITITPSQSGGLPITYTVTSTPGSYTATTTSTTAEVTGLESNTSYTFTAIATNNYGSSSSSAASSSITATTVPQAPTIGSPSATGASGTVSVPFTAGASGGSTITGYTVTSSPGSIVSTGSSSPILVTGLTDGTSYTFTITATNANGTSLASSASSSVTPSVIELSGGTLSSDATYNYRTFTSNGTLTVNGTVALDILAIAGGGGAGGFASAGGGGAGGLLYIPGQVINTGNYAITVGGGGAPGANSWYSLGSQGANSRFGSLTEAIGGGGGRSYNAADGNYPAGNGGSGGGGGSNGGAGGQGTPGQGNNGGNGLNDYNNGGGGGGAGSAGSTYSAGQGSGSYSSWGAATSTGVNVGGTRYYAGGGNGRDGTTTNGAAAAGVAGASNTGQGAGSTYSSQTAGGSGIVIVRWAK